MYERIVEQAGARFGLDPDKTKRLLGMVIGLIFNEKRGGPLGFLQAFRDKGFGDMVGSWLGQGTNQPITGAQLTTVLGAETIGLMSHKLGLPVATVSDAAAALLPDAVDSLSEHGELPTSGISETLRHWFGDLGEGLGNIEYWGQGAMGAGATAAGAGISRVHDTMGDAVDSTSRAANAGPDQAGRITGEASSATRSGIGKLLPWLLIGAAIIAALLLFR